MITSTFKRPARAWGLWSFSVLNQCVNLLISPPPSLLELKSKVEMVSFMPFYLSLYIDAQFNFQAGDRNVIQTVVIIIWRQLGSQFTVKGHQTIPRTSDLFYGLVQVSYMTGGLTWCRWTIPNRLYDRVRSCKHGRKYICCSLMDADDQIGHPPIGQSAL